MKVPQKNSLVKCTNHKIRKQLKIGKGQSLLFLGEIPNMPTRSVVVLPGGKTVWGVSYR